MEKVSDVFSARDDLDQVRTLRMQVGATIVAAYTCLGVGTLVGTDLPQPDVYSNRYTSGPTYGQLHRFNRPVGWTWTKDLTSDVNFYDLAIAYDENGNITRTEDNVWYDEFELRFGDSLRRSIDRGLANSRFGIVVLSSAFFSKNWPQYELNGLVTKELSGTGKVILPIWHKVSKDEVAGYSPILSDSGGRDADLVWRLQALAATPARCSDTRRRDHPLGQESSAADQGVVDTFVFFIVVDWLDVVFAGAVGVGNDQIVAHLMRAGLLLLERFHRTRSAVRRVVGIAPGGCAV